MMEQGREITTLINQNELEQTELFKGTCHAMETHVREFDVIQGKPDADIVFYQRSVSLLY